jgi:hypothetical protein
MATMVETLLVIGPVKGLPFKILPRFRGFPKITKSFVMPVSLSTCNNSLPIGESFVKFDI